MTSLDNAEVRAFLSHGTRTGKLGYLSPTGRPLVAPVWFVVEDGRLVFNTGKDTVKGRALARDPRRTSLTRNWVLGAVRLVLCRYLPA